MDFHLDIEERALNEIVDRLKSSLDDAVKTDDVNYAGAQMMSIMQLRSSQGKYLDKQTGGSARRRTYKSESHKKKRARIGLPIDRVTLFMGKVGVLEAMRVRARVRNGDVNLEVGYLDGLSEDRAMEIAGYLTDQGVGVNKVLYRFVGLTANEEDRIVKALSTRIGKNMTEPFN
jgi:hypothetical protein